MVIVTRSARWCHSYQYRKMTCSLCIHLLWKGKNILLPVLCPNTRYLVNNFVLCLPWCLIDECNQVRDSSLLLLSFGLLEEIPSNTPPLPFLLRWYYESDMTSQWLVGCSIIIQAIILVWTRLSLSYNTIRLFNLH